MINTLLKKVAVAAGTTALLMSLSISAFAATNSQNFDENRSSVILL